MRGGQQHARRAGRPVAEAVETYLCGSSKTSSSKPSCSSSVSISSGSSSSLSRRAYASMTGPPTPPNPATKSTGSYNVSYASLALAGVTGAGLYYFFEKTKSDRHARAALKGAQHAKVVGQADIGGPFTLTDASTKKPFSSEQLKGGYSLLYFGFCHCPDICPDELEKIASAIDMVDKGSNGATKVTPVFITLDPERDGPAQVAPYVKEFHPRMIGLTGSKEEITKVTKSWRVYYTKAGVGEMTVNGGGAADDDYLIDHSIITYLLDKDGNFVTFFGKNYTDAEMAQRLLDICK